MGARLRLALSFVLVLAAGRGQVDEYRVKAAFLYNFAKFVDWPPRSFDSPTAPISICVLGENPFGRALEEAVAGKTLGGRGFLVRPVAEVQQASQCHILFVSSSERKRLQSVLAGLRASAVLTVGDTPGFAGKGGVVNFKLEDGAVHFEINVEAAKEKNLQISSKLLRLAHLVGQ